MTRNRTISMSVLSAEKGNGLNAPTADLRWMEVKRMNETVAALEETVSIPKWGIVVAVGVVILLLILAAFGSNPTPPPKEPSEDDGDDRTLFG